MTRWLIFVTFISCLFSCMQSNSTKKDNQQSIQVKGPVVDEHTRCIHYHSEKDVIAIKMKCCGDYYPCIKCHNETAAHAAAVWPKKEFDRKAVLCGMCYHEMTINEYLKSHNQCPNCKAPFNPGCSNHYHLYFEMASNAN
mgnify:CR=1 FL=1